MEKIVIEKVDLDTNPGEIIIYYTDGTSEILTGVGNTKAERIKDFNEKKENLKIIMEQALIETLKDEIKCDLQIEKMNEEKTNKILKYQQILVGLLAILIILGFTYFYPVMAILFISLSVATISTIKYYYNLYILNSNAKELDKYLLYLNNKLKIENQSQKRFNEKGIEPIDIFNIQTRTYEDVMDAYNYEEQKVKVLSKKYNPKK